MDSNLVYELLLFCISVLLILYLPKSSADMDVSGNPCLALCMRTPYSGLQVRLQVSEDSQGNIYSNSIAVYKRKLKQMITPPFFFVFSGVCGLVVVLQVAVYPGNVLAIHMSKPQGFKYKSGQYVFVNCSAVSPFQWYFCGPFSFENPFITPSF